MRVLSPPGPRLLAASSAVALALGVAFACGDEDDPTSDAPGDDPGRASGEEDGAAPSPGAADAASPKTGLSPAFVHRDVNHVLSTGQSLSVGATGTPPVSTSQPYANLMFATGAIAGAANLTSFAPLIEGRVDGGANPDVETMSAGLANLVTKMARDELLVGQPAGATSHDLLVSVHGIGGTAYVGLKKGTSAYATGMAQAKAGFDLAKALGKSYVVRAVTTVHGESDHAAGNAGYQADLAEWQADYEKDVKALTGQADPIPMLQTQMSSWTRYGTTTSAIPQAQLAAHTGGDGKVVLVGPKYHLAYSPDGVHLTNEGYRHMGEDYAKVYRRVVLEGRRWDPVRPIAISRAGVVVTVKLAVPAPPLVLDTKLVADPGNSGFEIAQTGAPAPAIISVAVTAPDTVTITLAAEPTGTDRRLRYAFTAPIQASAGPTTGARGNLRDSDATPSRHGYPLHNWCVHFDEALP
ncbi:MAG: hypothetical protein KF764_02230 [Labilithrix sp.]|nr:hypothetical protein [Labilithrix sp.]